jgi:hypothetical protein
VVRILSAAVFALLLSTVLASAPPQTAATLSSDEQRKFLQTADVIGSRPIGKGVTGSSRLTLSNGTFTHDAGFQSIEDRLSPEDRARGRRRAGERNFVDSYKYNVAAYELARVLALDHMMPATVERRWGGRVGSLTWWVDDVLMDEAEREKSHAQPPSAIAFQQQRQRMVVFAELVHDTDRNKGNVLYTKDWRVIMIDFTRAFRLERSLRRPESLDRCDRDLFARLTALTADQLRTAAGRYLTPQELEAVMVRRGLIVERYQRLIRERGESVVLY